MKKISVIGHSHVNALKRAVDHPKYDAFSLNIATPKGLVDLSEKRLTLFGKDYFRTYASSSNTIALCWRGNFHNAKFLIETEKFDILSSGENPDSIQSRLVPVTRFQQAFHNNLEDLSIILNFLSTVFIGKLVVIPPPPPHQSNEAIKQKILDEVAFRQFIDRCGIDSNSLNIINKNLRMKLWKIYADVYKEITDSYGAHFLTPPNSTLDDSGFLLPNYFQNATHASGDYGRKVLDQLWTYSQDESVAAPAFSPHPYRLATTAAFWQSAVVTPERPHVSPTAINPFPLEKSDRIVSAGSCSASAFVKHIKKVGLHYVITEKLPAESQKFGYATYSASYGNVYNPCQMLQLCQRAYGERKPDVDRWTTGSGEIIDPFRPGYPFPSLSHDEFDLLQAQHFKAIRNAFDNASCFLFTPSITEAWTDAVDGSIYPACPGTVAGQYDISRHCLTNFTTNELVEDFGHLITYLRSKNSDLKFVLTVCPVPMVATATDRHVLVANTYSKSSLRVAAGAAAEGFPGVSYFPAYEIATSPKGKGNYYKENLRSISDMAISDIMKAFDKNYLTSESNYPSTSNKQRMGKTTGSSINTKLESIEQISSIIASAECEEEMMQA